MDFNSIFNTLKSGIISLAKSTATDYFNNIKDAGLKLADQMKDDLASWTKQYQDGELSKSDLEDLVKGKVTDLKLEALEGEIKAKVELDKFKSGLVDLITTTVTSIV